MKHYFKRKAISLAIIVVALFVLLIFIAAMKVSTPTKNYTYLALGDSYTIGEKVNAADNFPNQAVKMLREDGLELSEPVIVAQTGWTTDELEAGIEKAHLQKQYDFVSLLIGVNNQYRGRSVDNFVTQFERLLNLAIQFAGDDRSHVVVLSIPDWGATPFAEGRDRDRIAKEIDAYNLAIQQMAAARGVHYINITPGTRQSALDPGMLTEDGLHPSAAEYSKWAKQVARIINMAIAG